MTDFGHFAQGVVNQRNTTRQLDLNERAVAVQEGQLAFNDRIEQRNAVTEAVAKTVEQAVALVEGAATRDRLSGPIQQMRQSIERLSARAEQAGVGVTAQDILSTFDSAVLGAQTTTEQAQAEAQGAVAGARTTAEAVGGGDRTVGVLLGTEPLTEPEIVRLQQERDAAEQSGDTRRAQELTDIIAKRGTVTGTTEFDPSGPGFAEAMVTPTEDDVERLRTMIRTNQGMASTARNTLAAVEEAGGLATGFVGAATESITGILGNLGAIGDAINAGIETVTGADLQKLTEARTRMREGVASALPEITEETSGRFTDTERRIANETLRGLTPDASIDQVIAAYREFFRIINASDVRNAGEIARGSGLDLTATDGVNQLAEILKSNGMADDRILEVLEQVVPR